MKGSIIPQKLQQYLLLILAGLLNGILYNYFVFWLAWISLIPFFYAIDHMSPKSALFKGTIPGFITGLFLYNWIFTSTREFTGTDTLIGIPLIIITSIYFSLWWGIFAFLFNWLQKKVRYLTNTKLVLLGSVIWSLLEILRVNLFPGIPWVHYVLAYSQSTQPYLIQISGITGMWGVSFIIVTVNYLLWLALKNKSQKIAGTAVLVFTLYLGFGIIVSESFNKEEGKSTKFTLMQENINAKTRWIPETGDSLAGIFFEMAEKAATGNPDVVLWCEGSIPWSFTSEDDLFREVLKRMHLPGTSHILGTMYNPSNKSEKVYNSAFIITGEGKLSGRTDKNVLLSYIETDLIPGIKLPFFRSGLNDNLVCGTKRNLLYDKNNRLGVLICNESLAPYGYKELSQKGASLLVNISNDGWMEDSMLPFHHFYITVFRAVENGKYLVMNANNGYSGVIDPKGSVNKTGINKAHKTFSVNTYNLQSQTVYSKFGDKIFLLLSLIFITYIFLTTNKRGSI